MLHAMSPIAGDMLLMGDVDFTAKVHPPVVAFLEGHPVCQIVDFIPFQHEREDGTSDFWSRKELKNHRPSCRAFRGWPTYIHEGQN